MEKLTLMNNCIEPERVFQLKSNVQVVLWNDDKSVLKVFPKDEVNTMIRVYQGVLVIPRIQGNLRVLKGEYIFRSSEGAYYVLGSREVHALFEVKL